MVADTEQTRRFSRNPTTIHHCPQTPQHPFFLKYRACIRARRVAIWPIGPFATPLAKPLSAVQYRKRAKCSHAFNQQVRAWQVRGFGERAQENR